MINRKLFFFFLWNSGSILKQHIKKGNLGKLISKLDTHTYQYLHVLGNVCMLTFMQHLHGAFVVLPCFMIQTKYFNSSINRFRTQREILCVCDPENNTGFSPVPMKLLGCSSVQDEDMYTFVSTYELGVLIPSRVWGGWSCISYIWGSSGVWDVQIGLANLAHTLQDYKCPSGAAAGYKMGWPVASQMVLGAKTAELSAGHLLRLTLSR